jgi:diadenosine tetraphosphate (Ap4A) HIT family hydrolase
MFKLDERIHNSSLHIAELGLSQLRLHHDSRYPWLMLIPRVEYVTDVHQLSTEQQVQLISESSAVARVLETITGCDKINVANLGNVVAQLHWHIVARFKQDEAWPGPIWGVGEPIDYDHKKRAELVDSFLKALKSEIDLDVVV